MAKRKQRIRSPHPGVKLKKRTRKSGFVSYRAHYVDPDTGKEKAVTLDPVALPTKEARTAWAKQLSRQLARKRMDRAAGIEPPLKAELLSDTVGAYLESVEARLRPNTVASYRQCLDRFLRWASAAGVSTTHDLRSRELAELRDFLVRNPKATAQPGGPRGARRRGSQQRSRRSINCDLRSIKAMLNDLRKRGSLPHLHRDDIADLLPPLPVRREPPPFLAPSEMRQLLEAALRHDGDCFAQTRAEHAGQGEPGTTTRYAPIAPFVAFVLLTGMRRNEALSVRWSDVRLDALDQRAEKVGEIRLPAAITKTGHARTVGLEVSPTLRRLLAAMRLASGGRGAVFSFSPSYVEGARKRLIAKYGAPQFNWQLLRKTCSSYLTNAPGIYGAAAHHLSAQQLGHSVAVAQKHYAGAIRGLPHEARTLEAAMAIETSLHAVVETTAMPSSPRIDIAAS